MDSPRLARRREAGQTRGMMSTRRDFLIQEESRKIVARLGNGQGPQRCVTVVARHLLLNAPYFYGGVHIDPKAKPLGAGVWEITNGDRSEVDHDPRRP